MKTSLFVLALAASTAAPAERSRTYLISIASVPMRAGDSVVQFTIDTWGVEILSVCSIPPGWRIRAGGSATPEGVIEGRATHGVTRLNLARISRLRNLALVRIDGPIIGGRRRTGSGSEIATFLGDIVIGSSTGNGRQVRLTLDDIRLTPAARCPAV